MSSLSSDWEAFRIEAESVADWIATYRSTLEQLPVLSRVEPGEFDLQVNHLGYSEATGQIEVEVGKTVHPF